MKLTNPKDKQIVFMVLKQKGKLQLQQNIQAGPGDITNLPKINFLGYFPLYDYPQNEHL